MGSRTRRGVARGTYLASPERDVHRPRAIRGRAQHPARPPGAWDEPPRAHHCYRDALDRLRADAGAHGWRELFSDRYPHAGGEGQTAWYAENPGGFEVEVVATTPTA